MTQIPYRDPLEWFDHWFEEAHDIGLQLPNAVTLATVSPDGQPSARQVLLKDFGPRGFVFYTNYQSRKAHDLKNNPKAGLNFHWETVHRQIRIEGPVEKLSEEANDAYFSSRPRGSQIGAWASHQSRPLASRDELTDRIERFRDKFEGRDVPRPPHWGGYRITPLRFEFWESGAYRLHDRWEFLRESSDDDWDVQRLNP